MHGGHWSQILQLYGAPQHYWGHGEGGQPGGTAKAVGVTKLMQQCTSMLRERMGDGGGAAAPDAHAAVRCAAWIGTCALPCIPPASPCQRASSGRSAASMQCAERA